MRNRLAIMAAVRIKLSTMSATNTISMVMPTLDGSTGPPVARLGIMNWGRTFRAPTISARTMTLLNDAKNSLKPLSMVFPIP